MKVGDLVSVQFAIGNKALGPVPGVLIESIDVDGHPWWQVFRFDIEDVNKYHENWIEVINVA